MAKAFFLVARRILPRVPSVGLPSLSFLKGLNGMEDPSGCCHVGGCVSKGEVVLCDHYGMGVLGAGVV